MIAAAKPMLGNEKRATVGALLTSGGLAQGVPVQPTPSETDSIRVVETMNALAKAGC